MSNQELLITIGSAPASDGWGFVGVVSVGDCEAFRTIRAATAPSDALVAAQHLLAEVLGSLMAGQEWRTAQQEFGHPPHRSELEFGLQVPAPSLDGHRDPLSSSLVPPPS